ncbi:TPA: hypothetical protein ACXIMI_004179 [Stenotrophomonas maltophilia]
MSIVEFAGYVPPQCKPSELSSQPVDDQHRDDLAVDAFAAAMKAKMAAGRGKGRGGWEDPAQCTAEDLSRMLRDHVEKGDPRDVANFCMMLHQRGEAIAAIQPVAVALGPISLPPVPHGQVMPPDDRTGLYPVAHDDEAMQEYAREAVEADREQLAAGIAYVKGAVLIDGAVHLIRKGDEMDWVYGHVDGRKAKLLYAAPPAQAVDLKPFSMDAAPRDGTMVRLLVQFEENATEDTAEPAWTIGACNDDNVMHDERVGWQFAGWCWTHDHFTEGKGTPIGWLPLIDSKAVGNG